MEHEQNENAKKLTVQCSTGWEHDAAQKVVKVMQKALYAGLLGENWTVKVQRRAGGKLKVWLEAEDSDR